MGLAGSAGSATVIAPAVSLGERDFRLRVLGTAHDVLVDFAKDSAGGSSASFPLEVLEVFADGLVGLDLGREEEQKEKARWRLGLRAVIAHALASEGGLGAPAIASAGKALNVIAGAGGTAEDDEFLAKTVAETGVMRRLVRPEECEAAAKTLNALLDHIAGPKTSHTIASRLSAIVVSAASTSASLPASLPASLSSVSNGLTSACLRQGRWGPLEALVPECVGALRRAIVEQAEEEEEEEGRSGLGPSFYLRALSAFLDRYRPPPPPPPPAKASRLPAAWGELFSASFWLADEAMERRSARSLPLATLESVGREVRAKLVRAELEPEAWRTYAMKLLSYADAREGEEDDEEPEERTQRLLDAMLPGAEELFGNDNEGETTKSEKKEEGKRRHVHGDRDRVRVRLRQFLGLGYLIQSQAALVFPTLALVRPDDDDEEEEEEEAMRGNAADSC
mmetsp:Transcript_13173/g.32308  ORF Transcript_13173/g.32308 Transcript_13173/m.32308 type:complete len:452 (+) Transcript_13173:236-1591(+)